jgi:hypothetical protein
MSVCLGQTVSLGTGRKWSPNPRTHALCQGNKKMGRPRTTEPRDRQLNLSLTAAEYESLVRRAEAVGMRPVHYGRALMLSHGRVSASKCEPRNNISRLIHAQLVRLGNNLNQMVRHLHQTCDPLPADLEPLLADIRQIIARGISK